jgi:radical SAM superfamily enzyme YgiQ (UPF0313 family)
MTQRTPQQITEWFDANQHRFDGPTQYLGTEPNAWAKPWDDNPTRLLITASWPYNAAAGNQSIPAVYKTVNLGDGLLADRYYLPATPRDLKLFESNAIPMFGIESKHAAMDFDVVSTSISYSVLIMSFHKLLGVSGIPGSRKVREQTPEAFPMVMIGGQIYANPESVAGIADVIFLGECEDEPGNPGLRAVLDRITAFKSSGLWTADRVACYEALAREFNFLYFPRFVDVEYAYIDRGLEHPSKQVVGYRAVLSGMAMPFVKRFVHDLDAIPPLDDPPLLYANVSMGAGDLEVGRGCPAWCSFCALTYRQKPYRQRSVKYVTDMALGVRDNMGASRLSPFAPDTPMHTQKKQLVASLVQNVSDEVDSLAMRVDDFTADDAYITLQVGSGLDDVTLGLEGNSQRMRDLVGKGLTDAAVVEAVQKGITAGIKKFKLFMISDLPGEDAGDVMKIVKLGYALAAVRDNSGVPNVRIQFSWTPLLIEAGTPFQWFAPTPKVSKELLDVWEEFRKIGVEYKVGAKAEPNKTAFFQLCQRASREVGDAITSWLEDIQQACWGGVPRDAKEKLTEKLVEFGFLNGFDDCFDERTLIDMFGWEFIDQGVSIDLLWRTFVSMREFAEQTDSISYEATLEPGYMGNEWLQRCDEACMGRSCGVCSADDLKIRRAYVVAGRSDDVDLDKIKPIDQSTVACKIRAKLIKPDDTRLVENDHWRFAVRRAAFRAATKLGTPYTIAKRTIRFASDVIVLKDWTSGVDYVEFGMTDRLGPGDAETYISCMSDELAKWLTLSTLPDDYAILPPDGKTITSDIDLSLYELEVADDYTAIRTHLDHWEASESVRMVLRNPSGYFGAAAEEVNAKDYVDGMWLKAEGSRLLLKMLLRGRPTPYNIHQVLTGKPSMIEATAKPAVRLGIFLGVDGEQLDWFRPNCQVCGNQIPTTLTDRPFHGELCPQCADSVAVATVSD